MSAPPVNRTLLWTVIVGIFLLTALAYYLNRAPRPEQERREHEWVPFSGTSESATVDEADAGSR